MWYWTGNTCSWLPTWQQSMPWSAGRSMFLKWRPSLRQSRCSEAALINMGNAKCQMKWHRCWTNILQVAVMWCFLMMQAWASLHNESANTRWLHPSVSGYQHLIDDPCNDPTLPYLYSVQCQMYRMAPFPQPGKPLNLQCVLQAKVPESFRFVAI